MAAETILTTQTPATQDPVGAVSDSVGWKWQTTSTGKQVKGGRVYIPNTGKPLGLRWQLWQFPSTLLQDILLDGHTGSPNSWMDVSGITPQDITASTFYIVNAWFPTGGNYPYSSTGGPITSGSITAAAIYNNNQNSSTPPVFEGFTAGVFFADILLDDPGGAPVSGWRPKVNRHCTYLQQKTVGGNANYVKRRPTVITGFAADSNPRLRVRRTGEVYGDATVGVARKTDPDANSVGVYVSY